MEGMELNFIEDPVQEVYMLTATFNGKVMYNGIMDYCASCSQEKRINNTKYELLKRLNIKYEFERANKNLDN